MRWCGERPYNGTHPIDLLTQDGHHRIGGKALLELGDRLEVTHGGRGDLFVVESGKLPLVPVATHYLPLCQAVPQQALKPQLRRHLVQLRVSRLLDLGIVIKSSVILPETRMFGKKGPCKRIDQLCGYLTNHSWCWNLIGWRKILL